MCERGRKRSSAAANCGDQQRMPVTGCDASASAGMLDPPQRSGAAQAAQADREHHGRQDDRRRPAQRGSWSPRRPGRRGEPHRQQDERAHPVVGADARERDRRDALGQRRLPPDVEQREPDARWRPSSRDQQDERRAEPRSATVTSRPRRRSTTNASAHRGSGRQRQPGQRAERSSRRRAAVASDAEQRRRCRSCSSATVGPSDDQRRVAERHGERERRRP